MSQNRDPRLDVETRYDVVKVAEVVEVSIGGCGADGMSSENAWDAGEESIYDPLYASEFAHLSMADIVELSSNVEV